MSRNKIKIEIEDGKNIIESISSRLIRQLSPNRYQIVYGNDKSIHFSYDDKSCIIEVDTNTIVVGNNYNYYHNSKKFKGTIKYNYKNSSEEAVEFKVSLTIDYAKVDEFTWSQFSKNKTSNYLDKYVRRIKKLLDERKPTVC